MRSTRFLRIPVDERIAGRLMAAAIALTAAPVRAQPAMAGEDLAQQDYERGRKAFYGSNWPSAREAFTSANRHREQPHPQINFLIGVCDYKAMRYPLSALELDAVGPVEPSPADAERWVERRAVYLNNLREVLRPVTVVLPREAKDVALAGEDLCQAPRFLEESFNLASAHGSPHASRVHLLGGSGLGGSDVCQRPPLPAAGQAVVLWTAAGKHVLVVHGRREGPDATITRPFETSSSDQQVVLNLKGEPATLTVLSSVIGAKVTIDGKLVGRIGHDDAQGGEGRFSIQLPANAYTVEVDDFWRVADRKRVVLIPSTNESVALHPTQWVVWTVAAVAVAGLAGTWLLRPRPVNTGTLDWTVHR
jgi:hypothetical protein